MIRRLRSPQSIDSRIHYAIRSKGRGSVFVPADFLDMGSREAVDVSLHRLARNGTIRRLARGVYDFPKEHPVLGPLQPSAEAVAKALAGRDRTRLVREGQHRIVTVAMSERRDESASDYHSVIVGERFRAYLEEQNRSVPPSNRSRKPA